MRGLGPDVVHVAAAMTYTLLVLLAGLLAKGRATGREAAARVLIAAGIMLAPQLGNASYTLLLSPDHVGTGVPLLLLWLVIDRARPRWYVPVTAGVLLAWVQVADSLALIIGVIPLVIACAVGAWQERTGTEIAREDRKEAAVRRPVPRTVPALVLPEPGGAALASAAAAALAVRLIHGLGGYSVYQPRTMLATAGSLPRHLALAYQGVPELFGAGFAGRQPGVAVFFAAVHLAGVALAAAGALPGRQPVFPLGGPVVPAFAAAILLNLAAYIVSVTPVNIRSAREIASVMPLGAVLAGRLLAGPMMQAGRGPRTGWRERTGQRSGPAAARRPADPARAAVGGRGPAVLCGRARLRRRPAAGGRERPGARGMAGRPSPHDGLAKYWHANNTTLDSGGRVQLITVAVRDGKPVFGDPRETNLSWRDPRSHYANFVVTAGQPPARPG